MTERDTRKTSFKIFGRYAAAGRVRKQDMIYLLLLRMLCDTSKTVSPTR